MNHSNPYTSLRARRPQARVGEGRPRQHEEADQRHDPAVVGAAEDVAEDPDANSASRGEIRASRTTRQGICARSLPRSRRVAAGSYRYLIDVSITFSRDRDGHRRDRLRRRAERRPRRVLPGRPARARARRQPDPGRRHLARAVPRARAARRGPRTNRQLAESAGISSPTATRMVDGLLASGFVSRVEDPADRRAVLISLMPAAGRRSRPSWRSTAGCASRSRRSSIPSSGAPPPTCCTASPG